MSKSVPSNARVTVASVGSVYDTALTIVPSGALPSIKFAGIRVSSANVSAVSIKPISAVLRFSSVNPACVMVAVAASITAVTVRVLLVTNPAPDNSSALIVILKSV